MQAHQNFGALIDLNCCSKVQIALSNADRHPGTVSVELVVVNTSLAGRPSQSLGQAMVTSTLRWKPYDDRPPVEEILTFGIPAAPAIRQFDEARVLFQLHAPRADTSAKISIQRFLLVPRGL